MQNLVVRAFMASPTVFIDGIHLDAILLYEYCRKNDPDFYTRNINAGDDFKYPDNFPVKVINFDGTWFYACSDAVYRIDKTVRTFWNRRTDDKRLENYFNTKKKLRTSAGVTKNYRIPMNTNLVKEFIWYCVGDKEQIQNLLSKVYYLGKKHSQGKGQVAKWEVEEIDKDYSIFIDDVLIKTVPIDYLQTKGIEPDLQTTVIKQIPFKPPYWLFPPHPKADIRMCAVPKRGE